jgi:hypothetical protein
MTPDLEKSITEKYPALFANIGQKDSPMKFGLAVGDGWAGIISTMCWIINQKDAAKTFRFDQIKEKFGVLRVYHTGGSEYMAGVVRMAEDISGSICEVCGLPGEQRKGGWIKTLCDRCHTPPSDRLRQVSSQKNLTDEEREAVAYYLGTGGPDRVHAALLGLLSRTGSNDAKTGEDATECPSQGEKLPERERLTAAEREAVEVAAEAYASDHGERFAATLRALLERLG